LNREIEKLQTKITEFSVTKHQIKSSILSQFSKELFGFPPGKNKPGKPPNLKKIQEILLLFGD
jgi:hypothetical protein